MHSYKRLAEIEGQALSDRKAARGDWAAVLHDPAMVQLRVQWMLRGHYGEEAFLDATTIAKNTRINRVATLSQLIAAHEWLCPAAFARQAWLALPVAQQEAVNRAIQAEIDNYLSEEALTITDYGQCATIEGNEPLQELPANYPND